MEFRIEKFIEFFGSFHHLCRCKQLGVAKAIRINPSKMGKMQPDHRVPLGIYVLIGTRKGKGEFPALLSRLGCIALSERESKCGIPRHIKEGKCYI